MGGGIMCYFIHLHIIEENKASDAESFVNNLSADSCNLVVIEGTYPNYLITNGMCSCDFVQKNGTKLKLEDSFLQNIVSQESIKNVVISWCWGETFQPNSNDKLKMDVREFNEKNKRAELQMGTLYQLYDLEKYIKR